jgi:hypothetical protein
MTGLGGVARRAEVPPAVQEVPVGAADPRFALCGHRGEGERAHAGEDPGELRRRDGAALDDRAEVCGRAGEGGVEEGLELVEFFWGFAHTSIVSRKPDTLCRH